MAKLYTTLGLMSGTSGDGVDLSVIKTDGIEFFEVIANSYHEYPQEIYENYMNLIHNINSKTDIKLHENLIKEFERKYTILNAHLISKLKKNISEKIDLIGFHGQTIYHNPEKKISKQIGNAKLLFELTKTKIIYDFRTKDIEKGGQGAPLTPVFHNMLAKNLNLTPSIFLNIGGILNATTNISKNKFVATDIGPGMCLIDKWIKKNTNKKFDVDGHIASLGKIRLNLEYEMESFLHFNKKEINKTYTKSFDIRDFDISFVRDLDLEDGAATLVEYTARVIIDYYLHVNNSYKKKHTQNYQIILCGGGRKNKFLIKRLNTLLANISKKKIKIKLVDEFGLDGDFIESQAFGYLAARSFLNMPITFPKTTGCNIECSGGVLLE